MVPNFETHHPYEDRRHAGAVLAKRLKHLEGRNDLVVLAERGALEQVTRLATDWCRRHLGGRT